MGPLGNRFYAFNEAFAAIDVDTGVSVGQGSIDALFHKGAW